MSTDAQALEKKSFVQLQTSCIETIINRATATNLSSSSITMALAKYMRVDVLDQLKAVTNFEVLYDCMIAYSQVYVARGLDNPVFQSAESFKPEEYQTILVEDFYWFWLDVLAFDRVVRTNGVSIDELFEMVKSIMDNIGGELAVWAVRNLAIFGIDDLQALKDANKDNVVALIRAHSIRTSSTFIHPVDEGRLDTLLRQTIQKAMDSPNDEFRKYIIFAARELHAAPSPRLLRIQFSNYVAILEFYLTQWDTSKKYILIALTMMLTLVDCPLEMKRLSALSLMAEAFHNVQNTKSATCSTDFVLAVSWLAGGMIPMICALLRYPEDNSEQRIQQEFGGLLEVYNIASRWGCDTSLQQLKTDGETIIKVAKNLRGTKEWLLSFEQYAERPNFILPWLRNLIKSRYPTSQSRSVADILLWGDKEDSTSGQQKTDEPVDNLIDGASTPKQASPVGETETKEATPKQLPEESAATDNSVTKASTPEKSPAEDAQIETTDDKGSEPERTSPESSESPYVSALQMPVLQALAELYQYNVIEVADDIRQQILSNSKFGQGWSS
jgi:hypothetical protein